MKRLGCRLCCVFVIFITLFYGVSCGDISDKCVDLIAEMSNCSGLLHFPEKCGESRQSKLFECAELVAQKLPKCPDEVARKMIKHYVTAYEQSDSVICDHNLHAEFANNSECFETTRVLVASMAFLTPGFITTKGCKFFKTLYLILALAHNNEKCFKLAKDYLGAMFDKSTCGKVEIEIPTRKHFENVLSVFRNIGMCWVSHPNMSKCDSEKSRRFQCVEDETLNKINNTQMKQLEDNILMITKKTDEVFCANEKLRQDLESNPDCVRFYMLSLHVLLMTEINGFFTEEGCEGVRYKEKYRLAIYEDACRPMLQEYWTKMKEVLPCVIGETSSSSNGQMISGTITLISSGITLLIMLRNML